MCEGECRTPAWQFGKLPKRKTKIFKNGNSDDVDELKTQTSNTGTERRRTEVQINISRVRLVCTGEVGRGWWEKEEEEGLAHGWGDGRRGWEDVTVRLLADG